MYASLCVFCAHAQALQPITPLLEALVVSQATAAATSSTSSQTSKRDASLCVEWAELSAFLSDLMGRVEPTKNFLKLLAYVCKYRSLDATNDNLEKRQARLLYRDTRGTL